MLKKANDAVKGQLSSIKSASGFMANTLGGLVSLDLLIYVVEAIFPSYSRL